MTNVKKIKLSELKPAKENAEVEFVGGIVFDDNGSSQNFKITSDNNIEFLDNN